MPLMTESTTLPLRVVDALHELTAVPAIAPTIHAPRPTACGGRVR